MANSRYTAQIVQDLYLQQFKTDEDFFIFEHYKYLVGVGYAKALHQEYEKARQQAYQKQYSDPAMLLEITVQGAWVQHADVEVKTEGNQNKIELPQPVMTFPFDTNSFGIQKIRVLEGARCADFVRATERTEWMDDILPAHDKLFWFQEGDKNIVWEINNCVPKKVRVYYIPDISAAAMSENGIDIPSGIEDDVVRATLDLMFKARSGVVVDFTNNGNPNKALQSEIDKAFINIKTKPN